MADLAKSSADSFRLLNQAWSVHQIEQYRAGWRNVVGLDSESGPTRTRYRGLGIDPNTNTPIYPLYVAIAEPLWPLAQGEGDNEATLDTVRRLLDLFGHTGFPDVPGIEGELEAALTLNLRNYQAALEVLRETLRYDIAGGTATESPTPTQSWSTFRADVANTGTVAGATGPSAPVSERWSVHLGERITSSPSVAGEQIIVGDADGTVHAIDADDGSERWQFHADEAVRSSPAVVDGVVYVGSDDNLVYAIDLESGDAQWFFDTGGNIGSSPAVVDGTVYVGRAGKDGTGGAGRLGGVYALDAADGSRKWLFESGSHVMASPAVGNETVYVGTNGAQNSARFFALHAADGSVRWRTGSYGFANVSSSPALAGDTVFVGRNTTGDVGYVHAFDAESGEQRWRQTVERKPGRSSPAVRDGTVYLYTDRLYALHTDDGAVRWTFGDVAGSAGVSPAVDGQHVYVGSPDQRLYALGVADGSAAWTFETASPIRSSPAVADGVVYVGTDDGTLSAVADRS
jgi:outer membrane protein assembly factor BamB